MAIIYIKYIEYNHLKIDLFCILRQKYYYSVYFKFSLYNFIFCLCKNAGNIFAKTFSK